MAPTFVRGNKLIVLQRPISRKSNTRRSDQGCEPGDHLLVARRTKNGWLRVRNARSGTMSWVRSSPWLAKFINESASDAVETAHDDGSCECVGDEDTLTKVAQAIEDDRADIAERLPAGLLASALSLAGMAIVRSNLLDDLDAVVSDAVKGANAAAEAYHARVADLEFALKQEQLRCQQLQCDLNSSALLRGEALDREHELEERVGALERELVEEDQEYQRLLDRSLQTSDMLDAANVRANEAESEVCRRDKWLEQAKGIIEEYKRRTD